MARAAHLDQDAGKQFPTGVAPHEFLPCSGGIGFSCWSGLRALFSAPLSEVTSWLGADLYSAASVGGVNSHPPVVLKPC
jgi:hypothetical protein